MWLTVLLCLVAAVTADRVVMTNNGPLQGVTVGNGVEAYLGIPYAEPPVGRLRFMRPVPKGPWLGVYDASALSPPCIQNATVKHYYAPDITHMSEDCLYLNIWVPSAPGNRTLPVVFFVHGGAFNIGASTMPVYDGARMAARGTVVVVTINYRVGAMGFFSAFVEGAEGNMGLYDQLMALRWVRDNARAFGADPDRVTLMGESAGAMSVSGHLTSPLARGLFKRVILQSGADISPIILDENVRVYKTSQQLAKVAGCADSVLTLKSSPRSVVACLRRQPAPALARAEGLLMQTNPITFFPRVGDSFLPRASIFAFRDGTAARADVLVGINAEEGTFFLTAAAPQYFGTYGVGAAQNMGRRLAFNLVRAAFRNTEQRDEEEIADFYINGLQEGTSASYTRAISRALGDWLINCATVFSADVNSLRGNRVHYYVFGRRPSSTPLAEWMGTTHFDEMQYVFGNPLHQNFTAEEEALSRRMMDRWLAFVKTGDPNIRDAIRWEPYTVESPEYLEIDDEESVRIRPVGHRCEFWRKRFEADLDKVWVAPLTAGSSSLAFDTRVIAAALVFFHLTGIASIR